MTDNERELLIALRDLDDAGIRRGQPGLYHPASHVGGTAGSHHAVTLQRMVAPPKRWVDRRRRFEERPKSGWGYAITSKGREALLNDAACHGASK
jgi:hypothetical protein